jgi:2-polyprenyl-3-methyl-5-hydroxy-6-metoxy-1,4-benzoquinol methylase
MTSLNDSFHSAKLTRAVCGVCGATSSVPLLLGDRHHLGLTTVICTHCGHAYLSPVPDHAWYHEFYRNRYWENYLVGTLDEQLKAGRSRARQLLNRLRPWLSNSTNSLLDYGCGAGGLLAEFCRRYPSAKVVGVEPSEANRRFIADRLGVHISAELPSENHELIVASHVLEHERDPRSTLSALAQRLAPQGVLYVETPDLSSNAWHGPDFLHIAHLQSFTRDSLSVLAQACGLRILDHWQGPISEWPWAIGLVCTRESSGDSIQSNVGALLAAERRPRTPSHETEKIEHLRAHIAERMLSKGRNQDSATREKTSLQSTCSTILRKRAPQLTRIARRLVDVVSGRLERQLAALEQRQSELLNLLEEVTKSPDALWLFQNRVERMDATVPRLFPEERRRFHLARYQFAAHYVAGLRVADIAAGTGYGSELLARRGAAEVIGVDIAEDAVAYARRRHGSERVRFLRASGDSTGLETESLDAIVSFETLEHVPDDNALLAEFHRILRPGGLLICSTPNEWPLEVAPFHTRVYDLTSFQEVLASRFESIEMWNQNSGGASPFNRGQPAEIVRTTSGNAGLAECHLAVARRKP